MEPIQFQSRRRWNLIPDDAVLGVFWWKVTGGTGRVFVDILADEAKHSRKEQEQSFRNSLKGYGEVLQYQEMSVAEVEGAINGKQPEKQSVKKRGRKEKV